MTYKADDEVTITYSGLKQAQNEAFQDGISFASNRLARFFDKEPNLEKMLEFLSLLGNVKAYDEGDEGCSCEENCDAEGCEA
jgi:hypothetical protein